MNRVNNIAIKLALMALVLLASFCYAFTQNTSRSPYLDSWHKYTIPMVDAVNHTPSWQMVINGGGETNLTNGLIDGGEIWVRTGMEADAVTAYLEIKFIDAKVDVDDVVTIIYSEEDGNTCIARRSINATVVLNQFNLVLTDLDNTCNSYQTVWDNEDGNFGLSNYNHVVDFNVQMFKQEGFRAKSWRFTGTFTVTAGGGNNVIVSPISISGNNESNNFLTNGATWALVPDEDADDNTVTIEVTVGDPDVAYTTDNITFAVELNGKITEDATVRFQLEEGFGISGNAYPSEVNDSNNGNVRQDSRVVYGLPNTSVITAVQN